MQLKPGVVRALSMRSGRSLGVVLFGSLLCLVACAPDLPDDLPSLVQLMASNDMNVHTYASRKVYERYGVDGLVQALQSPSPNARRQAARFIRLHPEGKGREPIMEATKDEDASVRAWATFALSAYPDQRTQDRLSELLKDPDPQVRNRAQEGLEHVRSVAK